MLTVRQAQFAILSQLEVQKFEEWMLAHLRKFFPKECAAFNMESEGPRCTGLRLSATSASTSI